MSPSAATVVESAWEAPMPPTAKSAAPSPESQAGATAMTRDEVPPSAVPKDPAAPTVSAESDVAAASAAEAVLPPKKPALAVSSDNAVGEAFPALTKEEMIEEALNCPCIAGMKEGPCGSVFLEAYKCFLRSESSPQGMECMDHFVAMHGCMAEHPEEYDLDSDDDPFARKPPNEQYGETETADTADNSNDPGSAAPSAEIPVGDTSPATTDSTSDTSANSALPTEEKPKPPSAPAVVVPPQTPIAATSPHERTVPAVLLYARTFTGDFF